MQLSHYQQRKLRRLLAGALQVPIHQNRIPFLGKRSQLHQRLVEYELILGHLR